MRSGWNSRPRTASLAAWQIRRFVDDGPSGSDARLDGHARQRSTRRAAQRALAADERAARSWQLIGSRTAAAKIGDDAFLKSRGCCDTGRRKRIGASADVMPVIMCTRNLWRAIGGRGRLSPRQPDSTGPAQLGVWSARELLTPVGHFVVGLEETTYLTVVCPLLELPDFLRSFAASVATALGALQIPDAVCAAEAWAIIEGSRFAKNDNRSLLGSLNDVTAHADTLLYYERPVDLAALANVQEQLNHMPHVGREPAFPDQATRLLFAPASSV